MDGLFAMPHPISHPSDRKFQALDSALDQIKTEDLAARALVWSLDPSLTQTDPSSVV